jgi:hypothetical protein
MNLPPPPVKTPINAADNDPIIWQWQRWYNDLYAKLKELEDRIKQLEP